MAQHVKVLGILNILYGSLGVLGGLVAFLVLGGIGILGASAGRDDGAIMALPVLGGIGVFVFVVLLVVSLPSLIGGVALLQFRPWSRIFMIIISALHLLSIPIGTALGAYGLWVLLNRETEMMFQRPVYPPAYPRA